MRLINLLNEYSKKLETIFKQNRKKILLGLSLFIAILIFFLLLLTIFAPQKIKIIIAGLRYYFYDPLHTTSQYFFNTGVYYEDKLNAHKFAEGSFKRALKFKKGSFNINPLDPYQLESLYNLAVIYYMDFKDYPRALNLFTKYLEIFPREIPNPHEEDIYKVVNYILSRDDKSQNLQARQMKEKGNEFFFKKDYDKAIEYYLKAVMIDPSYVEAYNNLASAYLQKNDFENAVKYWKITLMFEPNDLDLYINVALASETKLAQFKEAIYYYELFIEKAPPNDPRIPEAKFRIEELKKILAKQNK